jgi:hypothetical protein
VSSLNEHDIPPPPIRRHPRAFLLRDLDGLLGALDEAVARAQARAPQGSDITREGWARQVLLGRRIVS